jgi:uncharacterized membrane protein YeaQ/YmgE (transglycosylase-associated protein family)
VFVRAQTFLVQARMIVLLVRPHAVTSSIADGPLAAQRRNHKISKSANQKDSIMNIIIWLVIGGLIGWLASIVMRTNGQQGIVLNVVVGIVGSLLGGWLLSPLVGISTINQNNFSLGGLLVSLVGAVMLLAIVNFARRGAVR